MAELYWNNFRMGQRYDAALRDDALLSAKWLNNFDIDYAGESADLKVRPGYTRWNGTELPAAATQLYAFVDMDQDFELLGISNARWRRIDEVGSHLVLVDEAATATRPIAQFGNRVFYGTDTDAYWSDYDSLQSLTPSYRMGIEKPTGAPTVIVANAEGRISGAVNPTVPPAPPWLELDAGLFQEVGSKYTPGSDIDISTLFVFMYITDTITGLTGQCRLTIREDNGGVPGDAISGDAVSDWVEVTQYDANTNIYVAFDLYSTQTLTSGTDYWFCLETDSAYKTNYNGAGPYFYYQFGAFNDATTAAKNNGAAWSGTTYAFAYMIDGLDPTHYYDYKYTYVNNRYNSESRPSERSIRISPTVTQNRILVTFVSNADPQIEGVNVYRRDIGTDPDIVEVSITDTWNYVGLGGLLTGYTDGTPPGSEGTELQSDDHYLYDESADDGTGQRAAFVPDGLVLWKGRFWAWVEGENSLRFTKIFEQDNPMGLSGESTPDYFPPGNVLSFPVTAGIINAKQLSNDQLAVYFRNEEIWTVSGADSSLNPPPPGGIAIRPTYQTVGLFAPDAVIPYSGTNIYLAREGLYRFAGVGNFVPELLSETQTGIFDLIENQYFKESKLIAYGREIWVLIDLDNDGVLDKLLILDLERDFSTRGLVDRAWKGRTYPVGINDLTVYSLGNTFREILAADATAGWIMKLNDGDDDNGAAIVATAESHDIRAPHNAFIHTLLIQAYYPDENNIPDYALTLTSHAGDTFSINMTGNTDITGNEDIRGHTIGLRMKRPISVRLKVVMTSTERDVIRGFTISYDGE
jgi:hypothetical protein